MIGLDTNVLVRYVVQDEPAQSAAAAALIESRCTATEPGFIATIVLAELVWVLRGAYRYDKPTITAVLRQILRTSAFRIEDASLAWTALRGYERSGADFADYLVGEGNRQHGCATTYTFDQQAARSGIFTAVP